MGFDYDRKSEYGKWALKKEKEEKKFGKNALPAAELDSWLARKRKAYKDREKS